MKKKFFMQKVTLHQGRFDTGGGWLPGRCELTDLYPPAQRESDQPLERAFVANVLKTIQNESHRLYTGSIVGGSVRRVNLIIKNINYWILQFSDWPYGWQSGFNWTKGKMVRDSRGLLSVHHKYTADKDSPAKVSLTGTFAPSLHGWNNIQVSGMFTIDVNARMENVPDYGGRFKRWLVTKWPKLKKRLKFITHPTFTVQLTIHTSPERAYSFDIASVEVDMCDQTVMATGRESVLKDEQRKSKSDFRSYGALQIR